MRLDPKRTAALRTGVFRRMNASSPALSRTSWFRALVMSQIALHGRSASDAYDAAELELMCPPSSGWSSGLFISAFHIEFMSI